MPILGAHMSIAGGYFKAIQAGQTAGCDCVQVFTKNNNRWKAKDITDDDVAKFKTAMTESSVKHTLSHASYLINLASPKQELLDKSIDAMVVELERAEKLGIPFVVLHPGSFTTSDEATGIQTICNSIDSIHDRLPNCTSQILLENTAGQGSNLGWQFEQLGQMLKGIKATDRVGVCIDTCHAFAAGYALGTETEYQETIKQLEKHVGTAKVKAFHLNDSKQPLGSRKDRHEHIGRGEMGLEPFRNLLNDDRFAKIPMYLETAKGEEEGKDLDVMNLETLRGLIVKAEPIA